MSTTTTDIAKQNGLGIDSFKRPDDFQALVAKDPQGMAQLVQSQTINIAKTFNNMDQVASLLQVAMSAAGHFPCSVPIARIMSRYQSIVNETETICFNFVNQIIASLKKHNLALKCIDKNKPDKALEMLSKCAKMAETMAADAEAMSGKAQELIDLSQKAFVDATNDKSITDQERKEMQQRMDRATEKAEELKKLVDQLAQDEAKAAEEAREYAKKSDKERDRMFITSLVKIGADAVKSVAQLGAKATPAGRAATAADTASEISKQHQQNQDATNSEGVDQDSIAGTQEGNGSGDAAAAPTTLDDLEAQANQRKWEIRSTQREKNAELTGVLSEMKNLSASKDDLQMAIKALETTIWAMGKVKTTFDLTKKFWLLVKGKCERLADIEEIEDEIDLADCSEEILDVIKDNAAYWIELGCLNMAAYNAIASCATKTNALMENLPRGHAERKKIVEEVSNQIISQIDQEKGNTALN